MNRDHPFPNFPKYKEVKLNEKGKTTLLRFDRSGHASRVDSMRHNINDHSGNHCRNHCRDHGRNDCRHDR